MNIVKNIGADLAQIVIAAAVAKAHEIDVPQNIAVVDAAGHLVAPAAPLLRAPWSRAALLLPGDGSVVPGRTAVAMDANDVWRASVTPAFASESKSASLSLVHPWRAEKETSPPTSARDCARTERLMFAANESIATSAATPNEMDDM